MKQFIAVIFIIILMFGLNRYMTSKQDEQSNNEVQQTTTEPETNLDVSEDDIIGDVNSEIGKDLSREYNARNYKQFRSDVKKFTDKSKNLDESY